MSSRLPPHAATLPPGRTVQLKSVSAGHPPHPATLKQSVAVGPNAGHARRATVAQRMDFAKSVYYGVVGNNIPSGVQEIVNLGSGWGVGYHASALKVVLYDGDGALAHVRFDPGTGGVLLLHTGTDRGKAGGMGYMKALFPVALRLIKKLYSNYQVVNMVPAPGAATKGLVSLLCQLYWCIPLPTPLSTRQQVMLCWAKATQSTADRMRKKRQQKPKQDELDPQQWNSTLMGETIYELACLDALEFIANAGLWIVGSSKGFNETVVGTSVLGRTAHDASLRWHQNASKGYPGTLALAFPLASLDVYLQALEVLEKKG